jgi:hypothetical protein
MSSILCRNWFFSSYGQPNAAIEGTVNEIAREISYPVFEFSMERL